MRELIIVAGANGSGKTTFAKKLVEAKGYVFLNADEIEKELTESGAQPSHLKAGRIFFRKMHELTEGELDFILESTLAGNYLVDIIRELRMKAYRISIVYLFLENPTVCIDRIRVRVRKGGHFVPDEDVIRRFYRSKRNFWCVYRMLADEWQVVYNSDAEFQEIAFGKAGASTIVDEGLYQLFQEDLS